MGRRLVNHELSGGDFFLSSGGLEGGGGLRIGG